MEADDARRGAAQPQRSSAPADMALGAMPNRKKLPPAPKRVARDAQELKFLDVHSIVPESHLLHRLVAAERQIDLAQRKRQMAMQEALPDQSNRKNTMPRILRFCVYNTHENQGKFYHADEHFESTLVEVPSWTLRIEGRLVDDEASKAAVAPGQRRPPLRKFTSFFKKIYVELDKAEFGESENWTAEWNRAGSIEDVDGFEIKRKSSKETTANIFLYLDHTPERFQVSAVLGSLLNLADHQSKTFTRTAVILQLWHYIRSHKLQQDPDNKANLTLDAPLRAAFGVERTTYHDIPKLLAQHLTPPEPIQISYQIKFSAEPEEQWFEIPVEVDNPAYQIKLNTHQTEIDELDNQIHAAIEKINEKKRKRDFYSSFASDPAAFLDDWLQSQIRDYKLWTASLASDPEFEKSTEFFMQPLAQEAFARHIASRPRRFAPQDPQISNAKIE